MFLWVFSRFAQQMPSEVLGDGGKHRLLIRLLKNDLSPNESTINWVKRIVSEASSLQAVNVRVSSRAIEFDVFSEDPVKVAMSASKLEQVLGPVETIEDLRRERRFQSDDQAFAAAISLYRAERFWEAHEVLESIWRRTPPGGGKETLQGLILLCAVYVHYQRGELEVALNMMPRVLRKLESVPVSSCNDIDMKGLRAEIRNIVDRQTLEIISLDEFKNE